MRILELKRFCLLLRGKPLRMKLYKTYKTVYHKKSSSISDLPSLTSRHKIISLLNYVNKLVIKYDLSKIVWVERNYFFISGEIRD